MPKECATTKCAIPAEVQAEIIDRVEKFNNKHLARSTEKYFPVIKGKFIYLMCKSDREELEPICRLTYSGDLKKMVFAIYKYSTEKYDPSECFFPGEECVNGTLEGAMKAGVKAYW